MKTKPTMVRRDFVKRLTIGGIGAAALARLPLFSSEKSSHTNVLFIISDDLRPQLGCYGETQMVTPNIDRLAGRGLVFDHSYCQQALCAPSRASLLTGLRPDSTGIYDLTTRVQEKLPGVATLPAHFKQQGYETISIGKVFHNKNDSAQAWSSKPFTVKRRVYLTAEGNQAVDETNERNPDLKLAFGPPYEMTDVADNAYPDGQNTDFALDELRRLQKRRFFLCVGLSKPHLPFTAPKKYWDLYDRSTIKLPANPQAPTNASGFALRDYKNLREFSGVPKDTSKPFPDDLTRALIHGYYASVSYMDAQVGRLLHELDVLELAQKTIVVLWGDNGFALGEHGHWSKQSNFETDTRVPLIMSVPGMKSAGRHTPALVEAVDVYPTLCSLCGLGLPGHALEGTNLTPLLDNPLRGWKKAVFTQTHLGPIAKEKYMIMGYALRTERYRYVEWRQFKTGLVLERELYDLQSDPGENANVIADPRYATALPNLEGIMKAGWKGALPN